MRYQIPDVGCRKCDAGYGIRDVRIRLPEDEDLILKLESFNKNHRRCLIIVVPREWDGPIVALVERGLEPRMLSPGGTKKSGVWSIPTISKYRRYDPIEFRKSL